MIDLLTSPDILCPIKVILDPLGRLKIQNVKKKIDRLILNFTWLILSGVLQ